MDSLFNEFKKCGVALTAKDQSSIVGGHLASVYTEQCEGGSTHRVEDESTGEVCACSDTNDDCCD